MVNCGIADKGLIDLAYRSGEITDISAHEVYENDVIEFEFGLTPKLKHIPALRDRGQVILYYAVYHTKSGGYGFEVMSKEDITAHMKQYSKAAAKGFSPWQSDFDAMAKKTVLKRLLKYAPLKTEFQRAVSTDETIKTQIDVDMQARPDETVIEAEAQEVDRETGEIVNPKEEAMKERAMEEAMAEEAAK